MLPGMSDGFPLGAGLYRKTLTIQGTTSRRTYGIQKECADTWKCDLFGSMASSSKSMDTTNVAFVVSSHVRSTQTTNLGVICLTSTWYS